MLTLSTDKFIWQQQTLDFNSEKKIYILQEMLYLMFKKLQTNQRNGQITEVLVNTRCSPRDNTLFLISPKTEKKKPLFC